MCFGSFLWRHLQAELLKRPKHVAVKYGVKYLLIIILNRVVLDGIFYIFIYYLTFKTTGISHMKIKKRIKNCCYQLHTQALLSPAHHKYERN